MLMQFDVELAPFDYKEEAYAGYDAPIIAHIVRAKDAADDKRECVPVRFGLIPPNIVPDKVKIIVGKSKWVT